MLFTTGGYSSTTSGHKRAVEGKIRCREYVRVPDLFPDERVARWDSGRKKTRWGVRGHRTNLKHFRQYVRGTARYLARSRSEWRVEYRMAGALSCIKAANLYCEFFGLSTRFRESEVREHYQREVWRLKEERSRRMKKIWRERKRTRRQQEYDARLKAVWTDLKKWAQGVADEIRVKQVTRPPGRRIRVIRRVRK